MDLKDKDLDSVIGGRKVDGGGGRKDSITCTYCGNTIYKKSDGTYRCSCGGVYDSRVNPNWRKEG